MLPEEAVGHPRPDGRGQVISGQPLIGVLLGLMPGPMTMEDGSGHRSCGCGENTLEDAVQDCLARGWLKLDREMIEWLQRSSDSGSQKASVAPSETGSSRGVGKEEDAASRREKSVTEDAEDEDHASTSRDGSQKNGRKPNTGKEVLPSHDGKTTTMREYERRVRLFQSSTGIDKEFQASKLIQHLTGDAWAATESLDVNALKCDSGVEMLLKHLWNELEPLEYLRTFNVLSVFYKQFKRERGQEMTSYDMEFRSHCKRLEEVGGALTGTAKAFWYLEKASISEELKRQVISGAGGLYEYERLRASLVAIVPQVRRHEESNGGHQPKWISKPQNGDRRTSHKVHAVDIEESNVDEDGERMQRDEVSEGDGRNEEDAEGEAARMEMEAEVLLTHAARKRAEFNKNRGFGKNESTDDRDKRIAEMKSRMPCAACKAAGFTRYGHWHGDPSCPLRKKDDEKGKSKSAGHTFVVSQEPIEEESDSDDAFFVGMSDLVVDETVKPVEAVVNGSVILATSGKLRDMTKMLALADTCCARTVAGEAWIGNHLQELEKRGIPYHVVPDEQPFRFGDGPRITAQYAVIFPLYIGQKKNAVLLRTSVVLEDVPLLISSKALKMLGTVVDLDGECYVFRRLRTTAALTTTATGHIGFDILVGENYLLEELFGMDWCAFDASAMEVAFSQRDKDHRVMITCIPQNSHRGSMVSPGNVIGRGCEDSGVSIRAVAGSVSNSCEASSTSVEQHDVNDGREVPEPVEEGGLRASLGSGDFSGHQDSADFDCGEVAPCVPHYETSEGEGTSKQLEAVCQSRVDGTVCREAQAGIQGIPQEEQGYADHGVGDLGRRRRSSRGAKGSKHGHTSMPTVQLHNGGAAEQDQQRDVLGLRRIPSMQGHLVQDHCRETCSSGTSNGRTGSGFGWLQGSSDRKRRGDERGDDPQGGKNTSSFCRRILGSLVQRPFYAKSGCITGSKDCSDQGGEGADQGAASCEAVSSSETPCEPLPEAEIRKKNQIRKPPQKTCQARHRQKADWKLQCFVS